MGPRGPLGRDPLSAEDAHRVRAPEAVKRKVAGVDLVADLTRDYAAQPGCDVPAHVLFPQLVQIVERYLHKNVQPLPPADVLDVALSPY